MSNSWVEAAGACARAKAARKKPSSSTDAPAIAPPRSWEKKSRRVECACTACPGWWEWVCWHMAVSLFNSQHRIERAAGGAGLKLPEGGPGGEGLVLGGGSFFAFHTDQH